MRGVPTCIALDCGPDVLPFAFNPHRGAHVEPPRPEQPQPIPTPRTPPSLWRTLAAGTVRTLAIQTAAKTAGLAVFAGLAAVPASMSLSVLVGGLGALSGGSMAFLLGRHQIGTASAAQKAAVAVCAVTGAAAGGAVAVLGCWQPVATFAIATVATGVASTLVKCGPPGRTGINRAKAVSFSVAATATLLAGSLSSHTWSVPDETLVARNFGAVFESVIIDGSRATFEQFGPSSNRAALSFEGAALGSVLGTLPYSGASVVINGVIASFMQPPHDSHKFLDLFWPVLLSTLVNAIRDPANSTAIVMLHRAGIGVARGTAPVLRPHRGPQAPELGKVTMKSAIRYALIICRNAIYLNMRQAGLSILQAGCVAQLVYSLFAQNREILFDLMQGAGWTVPAQDAGPAIPNPVESTTSSEVVETVNENDVEENRIEEGGVEDSSTIVGAVQDSSSDSGDGKSGDTATTSRVVQVMAHDMEAAESSSEYV